MPPWGLTAPPWSSSAPSQPLPDPAADSPTPATTPQTTAAAQAGTVGQATTAGKSTSAGQTMMDTGGTGADGDPGLGILDAPVGPTHQARSALSDQTVVLPSVPAHDGPAGVEASPGWRAATQPASTAAHANPTPSPANVTAAAENPSVAQAGAVAGQPSFVGQPAWSPGVGADPALAPPAAPPPVQQYHQQPSQTPYAQGQHQTPYPGQQYHPAPEPYRPAYADGGGSTGRSRAAVIGAVVAAGVAVVAVAGLGAVVLTRDDPPPAGTTPTAVAPAPTATGPAPGDLTLRDDSTTITLTWTDPTGGAVPFMVAAGRAGQALGVIATVDPGRTSYTVNGLNSRVDHCFTVLAVYSTDSFATSGQVCTARERKATSSGEPSGRPSPR